MTTTRRKFLLSAGVLTAACPALAHWTKPGMTWSEWASHDALGIANLVKSGDLSIHEVADQTMHAVHALNPRLNAVLEFYYDRLADPLPSQLPDGIFHGAPYFFKDVGVAEQGRINEWASKGNHARVIDAEADYLKRKRAAGLHFLGTCAAPELGTAAVTESLLNGYTHNPWELKRTPGGSSGGGASAVASGMLPMAAANDGGGSTRIPASLCGNVGLKHSREIANQLNGNTDRLSLVDNGVNSRSVRDTAAFLDAVLNPGQTNSTPGSEGSYLHAIGQPLRPLKIALSSGRFGPYQAPPDATAEMERIGRVLADLGHTVEEADADLPYIDFYQAFKIFWTARGHARMSPEDWAALEEKPPEMDLSEVEPITRMIYTQGKTWTWEEFKWAVAINEKTTAGIDAFLSEWDCWLTPAVGTHTPYVGSNLALSYGHQSLDEWWFNTFRFIPYTPLTNFSGHPSISLPVARFNDGMPLGAHFIGPNMGDGLLLQLGAQLEQAQPWFDDHPPVHVTNL